VWCWGNDDGCTLGHDVIVQYGLKPLQLSPEAIGVTGVVALARGLQFDVCAITAAGDWCWGDDEYGELGDGQKDTELCVPMITMTSPTIALGGSHSCSVAGGRVVCWGANDYGQLGDGSMNASLTPVGNALTGVTSVCAGFVHTCAVTSSGALFCWGLSSVGQVGDGTHETRSKPTAILDKGVATVTCGSFHTCALMSSGAITCWGANQFGQLGDGTFDSRNSPVAVVGF